MHYLAWGEHTIEVAHIPQQLLASCWSWAMTSTLSKQRQPSLYAPPGTCLGRQTYLHAENLTYLLRLHFVV